MYCFEAVVSDWYIINRLAYKTNYSHLAKKIIEPLKKQVASLFFDYLFAACICEARHCYGECEEDVLTNDKKELPTTRRKAYIASREFDPLPTLKTLIKLFSCNWNDGYGGENWKIIAETAYKFLTGRYNETTFIEKAIYLQHNGFIAYNKPYMMSILCNGTAQILLELFRNADILRQDIIRIMPTSERTKKLFKLDSITIYKYQEKYGTARFTSILDMPYVPRKYGNKTLVMAEC